MPTFKRRSSRKFRALSRNLDDRNPCIEYIRQASGGELAELLHEIAQRTIQLSDFTYEQERDDIPTTWRSQGA